MAVTITIHPETPQERNIKKAVEMIRAGGCAVLPTDSGYALACTLENKDARERILSIRNIDRYHNFTLLCADLSELSLYARVDNAVFRLLKNNTPGPYTFILKATKEVPRKLMNERRKTIGLRVPGNPIMQALLQELGEPLMSVSLILPGRDVAESDPYEIDQEIGNRVDLLVDGGNLAETPTTVVDFTEDGTPDIMREGAGDPTPFLS
ncbi:MAG: L-threonylcarbamoyladenylate synthase [Succinivibrionaceae bacterium]|nr:L-threonylcarbamoyladenylate synthase [Succinivibrionaceae bacterium]